MGFEEQPDAPARVTFAGNVRRVRKEQHITQETLAERSGLHRTFVSSVERGERNISVDNMERVAHALRTTVAILVTPLP
ncbi:MAG TPA: helix-turn-helix transcriptional regulator [Gemmatimonadaceae bacterium]|jgi:transcriptional regulator with XRE-family HTH domain|nr:helix-turn-helix transcriptional regulator [Gemmatimonadaceae bacterium]